MMREKANPQKHRISFLLGAGASYGHLITHSEGQTPPIMSNFLSVAVRQGILTEREFPELAEEIKKRCRKSDLFQSCTDLESSGVTLESFLSSIEDIWVLQLSRFFLYRYLGEFCSPTIDNSSAYLTLARYVEEHIKDVGGIISLNYDTLCEAALASTGVRVNYVLAPNNGGGLPCIKPHGSVNFRFPIARGFIGINVADWSSFLKAHNAIIETNRFSGQWVETYQPTFSFERDFLTHTPETKNRKLEYIPALVPPLAGC